MNLCVNPEFHQWQQRYVALAGGYRTVPELTPNYSTILVRGEGPQRQIERVPLADIRMALDAHATFILLAQPGAGKTTVLQRIALDKAQRCLVGDPEALLPLFVRLAAQGEAESPHDFLARMWQAAMPGDGSAAAAELQAALHKGRLCLLVDALNESRREHYAGRMLAWRDFARELPPGNRLVFTCRKLDYNGELMVQQVEIDPLDDGQIRDFAVRYLEDEGAGQTFWAALEQQHQASWRPRRWARILVAQLPMASMTWPATLGSGRRPGTRPIPMTQAPTWRMRMPPGCAAHAAAAGRPTARWCGVRLATGPLRGSGSTTAGFVSPESSRKAVVFCLLSPVH